MAEIENPPSVRTPSNGKILTHPSLPQTNGNTCSLSTLGASSKHIIPGYRPPYANPAAFADGGSSAHPSGHDAKHTSPTEPTFAPSAVIPAAPNPIHDNIPTSQDNTLGIVFGMHPIGSLSSFHPPALVSFVYEGSLEEPVEEELMSRYTSTPLSTPPPPYSYD